MGITVAMPAAERNDTDTGGGATSIGPGLGIKLAYDRLGKYHELSKTKATGLWIEDPKKPSAVTYYPKW